MSYFDDASLVMIPSGYKTSKVYSVKPTDGTGDLTFTRTGDTATRVNSAGLIEKVRTNLALYSEQFDNAYWGKTNTTVVANSSIAPNGTTTAELVYPNSSGSSRLLEKSFSISASTPYTGTWYAKASGLNWVAIDHIDGNVGAWFNLSTGTIGTVSAGTTASIENVGNGWYRCRISKTSAGTTGYHDIRLVDGDNVTSVTASGTNGVLVWGAQLETGDIATDYIATTTAAVSVGPVANVPRLDYLNSSCPRLLLEPQRTNAQTYSEDFSQGKYTKTDCTISTNVAATLDPAGTNVADKLVEAVSVGGQHYVFFSAQTGANQETQISIFAKAAERTEFLLWESAITNAQARFNLSNGTIAASSSGNASNLVTTVPTITNYGNGWYRCTLNFKTASGGGTVRVQLYNGSTSYNGNGTSGIYLWGLQEEVNVAYATSYIPTLGAAVTRGGDDCGTTSLQSASLIGATAGTFFVETIKTDDAIWFNQRIFLTNTTTRSLLMDIAGGQIRLRTWDASSAGATITTSGLTNGVVKYLIKWDGTNIKVFANGVLVGSSAQPSYAYTTYTAYESPSFSNNELSQLLFFPTALSDADCIALTA